MFFSFSEESDCRERFDFNAWNSMRCSVHLGDSHAGIILVMLGQLLVHRCQRLTMPAPRSVELYQHILFVTDDPSIEVLAGQACDRILFGTEGARLPLLNERQYPLFGDAAVAVLGEAIHLILVLRVSKLPKDDLWKVGLLEIHALAKALAIVVLCCADPLQSGLTAFEFYGNRLHHLRMFLIRTEEPNDAVARIDVLQESLLCFLVGWDQSWKQSF
mmetsp:Transcript_61419/g.163417  ORF Transcript_61419/g.163417 Transcript_61419/m.163417 type:complete len:217 (+) Transcript_61419:2037-2687(+)